MSKQTRASHKIHSHSAIDVEGFRFLNRAGPGYALVVESCDRQNSIFVFTNKQETARCAASCHFIESCKPELV